MKTFRGYHPVTLCLYCLSVLVISLIQSHPLVITVETVMSAYLCHQAGVLNGRYVKGTVLFFILIAFTNPLFVHQGITVLFYIGTLCITLESFLYGICMGMLVVSVLNWFRLFNALVSPDMIVYLFSGRLPTIGFLLSSVYGLIPKMQRQAHKISESQRALGKDIHHGTVKQRLKYSLDIFLILFTWVFESSLTTLSSMLARGYGKQKRTVYPAWYMEIRDWIVMALVVSLDIPAVISHVSYSFYPVMGQITVDKGIALYVLIILCLAVVPMGSEIVTEISDFLQ